MQSNTPRSVELKPYSTLDPLPVRSVEVEVLWTPAGDLDTCNLQLNYTLYAELASLRIPPPKASCRTDELWKHTCFEAFLRPAGGTAYYELNASPSTEWALYRFEEYRKGMAPLNSTAPPLIRVERSGSELRLDVRLTLPSAMPACRVALAAVIEDKNGTLTYWALKHPAARPDFHHSDSFTLEL